MTALQRVRRATDNRERSVRAWHDAIRQAHSEGLSLRVIAEAAGVSHVWVMKIVRGH